MRNIHSSDNTVKQPKHQTNSVIQSPVKRFPQSRPIWQADHVAVEEPLQIQLSWCDSSGNTRKEILAITMRTPGSDEALIYGLLYAEGIIRSKSDILSIDTENENGQSLPNQRCVKLAEHIQLDWQYLSRHLAVNSACGLCGKTSLQALELKNPPTLDRLDQFLSHHVLLSLGHQLSQAQSHFASTGGSHASALFTSGGELTNIMEDVGRHNALDKLVGQQLMNEKLSLKNRILVVSGRASYELVQKAVMAGFPVLAAIGAPSSLAIQAAQRFGLTLIGFLRQESFNIYHGDWRIN